MHQFHRVRRSVPSWTSPTDAVWRARGRQAERQAMQIEDLIRSKRAVRDFVKQPVSAEIQLAILEAGRRAPSAMNRQPWSFLVVTDPEKLEQLADVSGHSGHLANAAFGLVLLIPEGHWPVFDAGQAAAYMQLAAWDYGVASCIGSFVDPAAARALLDYPEELRPVCCLSFGHPPKESERPARQGGRKPLNELVHWNRWGATLP